MKWIGLTGGIASGKSTVAKIFKQRGLPVVDADEVARLVVQLGSEGLSEVVSHFGKDVLSSDGNLQRKALGQKVFQDPAQLKKLESILHPLVKKNVHEQRQALKAQGFSCAIYDVPLLFEKSMEKEFDAVIVVTSTLDLQKQRMKNRDGLSDQNIENRLRAQFQLSEKEKRAHFVVHNHGSLQDLEKQVTELIEKLSLLKSKTN